jgi:hypothetical protein
MVAVVFTKMVTSSLTCSFSIYYKHATVCFLSKNVSTVLEHFENDTLEKWFFLPESVNVYLEERII